MRPKLAVIMVSGFHLIPVICVGLEQAYLEQVEADQQVPAGHMRTQDTGTGMRSAARRITVFR